MSEIKYTTEVVQRNTYTESWERTKLWCPRCGGEGVWIEAGDADIEFDHLCVSCGHTFCYSEVRLRETQEPAMRERLAAIRALGQEVEGE